MNFYIAFASFATVVLLYPYVRCFVKRIVMAKKLKKMCRTNGFSLYPTHPFWMLGRRGGACCDFYVETEEKILSVKLFGVPRRSLMLVFTEDGKYFFRRILVIRYKPYPIDRRQHLLPNYDFRYRFRKEWELKTPMRILLVNPVSHEIRRRTRTGGENIVGAGETASGMLVYPLSRFIGLLEGEAS